MVKGGGPKGRQVITGRLFNGGPRRWGRTLVPTTGTRRGQETDRLGFGGVGPRPQGVVPPSGIRARRHPGGSARGTGGGAGPRGWAVEAPGRFPRGTGVFQPPAGGLVSRAGWTPGRWRAEAAEAVVAALPRWWGWLPRPAYASSIQYPTCPDRAEPQVIDPTVSCPTNSPPNVTTHGIACPCRASRRIARTIATYGPRLDRYSGVSGLVGSHGRSHGAFLTRISATCGRHPPAPGAALPVGRADEAR